MAAMPRIYRSLSEVGADFGPCALTIGNFDGLHEGHRDIMRQVVATGRAHGWKPSVLTFDPHPTKVVAPARAPRLLTTPDERAALMAEEGIEQVLILPFDLEFSRTTAEQFVERILVGTLGVKAVLVGDNFHFGKGQGGNTDGLRELGHRFGFDVHILTGVRVRGGMASSSEVRRLIQTGDVARACRMLGRPYALEGDVVPGRGVGSKQTVPTLNLATAAEVIPGTGVYVTETEDLESGRRWPSITNIGHRPTFGGGDLSIETFLLERLDSDAPQRIRVAFRLRLRDERKFESPDLLKLQIGKDVGRAKAWFRRVENWVGNAAPVR
jgi:riboflavin kinase/FMN adenylyltransferase